MRVLTIGTELRNRMNMISCERATLRNEDAFVREDIVLEGYEELAEECAEVKRVDWDSRRRER